MKKFHAGDLVLIKSQKYTEPSYGTNETMVKNIGSVHIVEEASHEAVKAGGGFWRLEDIQMASPEKTEPPKPLLFDVKELDI